MKKKSYNETNPNSWIEEVNPFMQYDDSMNGTNPFLRQQEPNPFNEYDPVGYVQSEDPSNMDRLGDHDRGGKEFNEFRRQSKRKKRLDILKKMLKDQKKALQPAPFYSSVYGYTGFEGMNPSPLEYYSGSISDEPGAITNNPYNNTYQAASSTIERVKIRAMIFKDFFKK